MKKLTQEKQISHRSRPEIVADLDLAAAKLARVAKIGGEKLRTGHLVNAVALWLGRLSDDDLESFAVPLIRDLEKYLGRATENKGEGESVPPGTGTPIRSTVNPRPLKQSHASSGGEDEVRPDLKNVPARRGRKV